MKAVHTLSRSFKIGIAYSNSEIYLSDGNEKEEIVEVIKLFVGKDRDQAAILGEDGRIIFLPIHCLRFNPNDLLKESTKTPRQSDWPDYP